jgi:polyhydroxyalkanoate synthase subunit PhaC
VAFPPFPGGWFDPAQLAAFWQPPAQPAPEKIRRGLNLASGAERVPTGLTPKEIIWTKNKAQLYHYLPQAEQRYRTPLLLIYALINKSYILDLYPGNSFVEHMVRQGFEVYLLDWGQWALEDRDVALDDLVLEYIPGAVRQVMRHADRQPPTIMGYCIGGILTSIYTALHPEAPLRNVAFMAAPIDFSNAGLLTNWLDPRYFPLDKVLAAYGNMPGELVEMGAKLLKPVTNYITPYVNLGQNLENDRYLQGWAAMSQWVHDRVDFPGAAFRQLVADLYQANRLIKGELVIGGRTVELSNIHWPALLIAAERDHIAPLSTTLPLFEHFSNPDKEKLVIPAGHVGLVAGRGAVNGLWPKVSDWLAAHSA